MSSTAAPTYVERSVEHALHWPSICLLVLLPLSVATINPGTGLASGYAASILAFAVALVFRGLTVSWDRTAWMVALAAVVVLLSPYWNSGPSAPHSASRAAAAAVAFVLVLRWTLRTRRDFYFTAGGVAVVGTVYAIYFLNTATALDVATARLSVGFSNANYTAAVLAFAIVCSLLTFGRARTTYVKLAIAGATLAQALALVSAGSRAATAGIAAAVIIYLVARRWEKWSRLATLVIIGVSFVIGLLPSVNTYLNTIATALDGYGPFHRSASAISDASGRTEIWRATRHVVGEAPWLGWGPGDYYIPAGAPPNFVAHSWALEYVASVGLLGAAVIVALLVVLFTQRGPFGEPYDLRWNASTAISIAPVLALSTHQWTLWAWFAFALWSRSHLIAEVPIATPAPRSATPRRPAALTGVGSRRRGRSRRHAKRVEERDDPSSLSLWTEPG